MPNVIAEFLTRIGYQVDKNSQQNVENSVKKVDSTLQGLKKTINLIMGAAVLGVFRNALKETASEFDKLGHVITQLGPSADAKQLSAFGYAASISGASAESASQAYINLNKAIGQTAMGVGRSKVAFEQLGIAVKNADGSVKNTSEVLTEIQQKLAGKSRPEQAYIVRLLGMSDDMLEVLTTDTSSLIDEFNKLTEDAGLDFDKAAQDAMDFGDELEKLNVTAGVIKKTFFATLFKGTTNTFIMLRKFLVDNVKKIMAILRFFSQLVQGLMKGVMEVLEAVLKSVGRVMDWFNNLSDRWKRNLKIMGAAWLLFNALFMKSPIGKLLSLLTILGLLIEDFEVFKEGGKSAINWNNELIQTLLKLGSKLAPLFQYAAGLFLIIKASKLVVGPILSMVGVLKTLIRIFLITGSGLFKLIGIFATFGKFILEFVIRAVIMPLISALWSLAAAFLATPVGWIVAAIAAIVAVFVLLWNKCDGFRNFMIGLWDGIKAAFSAFVDWITSAFSGLWDSLKAGWNWYVDFIKGFYGKIWDAFKSIIDGIRNLWSELFDWIAKKFEWVTKGIGKIKSFLGFGDNAEEGSAPAGDNEGNSGGFFSKAFNTAKDFTNGFFNTTKPSPVNPQDIKNTENNINQENNVTYNITESKDAKETAQEIQKRNKQLYADQARNLARGMQ